MILIRCVSCRTGLASFRRLDPDLQRTLSVPPHTYEDQACLDPNLQRTPHLLGPPPHL